MKNCPTDKCCYYIIIDRHGRPPLSTEALYSSANFTLSLLPIRLAKRIQALRNLPFIVVSNPNINKIYNNYLHSLSTLLPWQHRTISNLDAEIRFTSVLAELVSTHDQTIPILAVRTTHVHLYIHRYGLLTCNNRKVSWSAEDTYHLSKSPNS